MTEIEREVGRLLIVKDGRMLVATSARSGSKKIPGGGTDGQSPREAGERELIEETGLRGQLRYLGEIFEKITAIDLAHGLGPGSLMRAYYFEVLNAVGEMSPGDDVAELELVPIDRVEATLTYPGMREGFRKFRNLLE